MVIFESRAEGIQVPPTTPIFDFFFTSPTSPLSTTPPTQHAGFQNALTKDRLSYSQVRNVATHISTALAQNYHIKPDETISLFSQNSIWYPVAMFAGLRLGARISGASPAYGVEEMAYAMRIARTKILMTMPESLDVAIKSAELVGLPRERIVLLEGKVDGFASLQDLVKLGAAYGPECQVAAFKIPAGKTNADVCGFLSFSSGTTGLPKAVMISHANVIAQCLQIRSITPTSHRKIMAVLPLFHITGLVHQMHLPILLNAEVLMLPSFSVKGMLDLVVEYQPEELLLVPPILIRLVRDPLVDEYDLSCVKRFSSGAAPLSEEILALLEKKFPGTGFKQGYGMTESCSCITAHFPEYYAYKYAHSGGNIVASTQVKILKPDGSEAGVGESGEVLARGPQVVMGYLGNEAATRETFDEDGWLHTGDQGYIDEENMVYIQDRIKELIKVKGIGVAPAELEDLLLGHPDVEDVAVMGIADEYSGEKPKAFVVLKEKGLAGTQMGRKLLAFVREKKVRYKWIKEVEFVGEIPKSASGKILRRVLRDKEKKGEAGLVVRDEAKAKL